MNSTVIAMGMAGLLTGAFVVTFGVASLLSGGMHFLFVKPRLNILKSKHSERGLAFGFEWNSTGEGVGFDQVKVRLFDPFGKGHREVSRTFSSVKTGGAVDVDMGSGMARIVQADSSKRALVQIELGSLSGGVFHQFEMKADKFKKLLAAATESPEQFDEKRKQEGGKPLYTTVKRSFVADPLPKKSLKLETNPAFAADFSAPAAAEPQENFAVSKVWIDPGCIVCNACEGIYPEVFEVTDTTCLIRPEAPLHDGLKIFEAAEACPVEVIKFERA